MNSIVMERQLASPGTSILTTPSPKQRFVHTNIHGVRSPDAPASPRCDLDSVTVFQNALLIHQKRLKISNSQLFQTFVTIDPLISAYYAAMELAKANGFKAGPDAARARKQKRMNVIQAIERYDGLLEERRQILQHQDASLESAFGVKELKGTDKMLEAIDIQIAAAEDLAERMAVREAKKEWKIFKAVPWL